MRYSAPTLGFIRETDLLVAQWFHAHAVEPWTGIMLVVSYLHSVAAIAVLSGLLGLYFWRRRAHHWLWVLAVGVPGGILLNVMLKLLFQRTRPVFDQPLVTLASYSFPSGHTAASAVFYGILASYVMARRPAWPWRVALVAGCAAMVLLVAASRLYLGAHYLSDVLAALLESGLWLWLCLLIAPDGRSQRSGAP